jgi:hypothetical protein
MPSFCNGAKLNSRARYLNCRMDVSCRQNMPVGSRPRIWSPVGRKRIEAEPRRACVGASTLSAVAFRAQQLIAALRCCRGEPSPDL